MNVDLPLVSISVPSYNCSEYIISTLDSVKNQTYSNLELIIAEDCSTDDSKEKIINWMAQSGFQNVKLIENKFNLGVVKTCNIILNNFKGKYYSLLGADDILMPDKIEKQVELFETLDN
jgi:glycosyltransferase involved in cell wall biosynthesis